MNLSKELANMRKSLKPTETKITTADGFQYVEPSSLIYQSTEQTIHGRPPNLVLQPATCSGYVVDDKPDLHIGEVTRHILIGENIHVGVWSHFIFIRYIITCTTNLRFLI